MDFRQIHFPTAITQTIPVEPHTLRASSNDLRSAALRFGSHFSADDENAMAGLIPQSFIDDLLNRTDIVDVVSSRLQLKKAGKEPHCLLPVPQRKTPLSASAPTSSSITASGCGAGGNALGFHHGPRQPGFPPGGRGTGQSRRNGSPREESGRSHKPRQPTDSPLYPLLTAAADFYRAALKSHPARKAAVDYLKGRGLTGEIAGTSAWALRRLGGTTCSST